jgi:hypothetical protein
MIRIHPIDQDGFVVWGSLQYRHEPDGYEPNAYRKPTKAIVTDIETTIDPETGEEIKTEVPREVTLDPVNPFYPDDYDEILTPIPNDVAWIRTRWDRDKTQWVEGGTLPEPEFNEEFIRNAVASTHTMLYQRLQQPMQHGDDIFTVTMEKQNLLAAQIALATLAAETGTPFTVEWNATGGECREWPLERLVGLAFAIAAYVRPLVAAQRHAEVVILKAKNHKAAARALEKFKQALNTGGVGNGQDC